MILPSCSLNILVSAKTIRPTVIERIQQNHSCILIWVADILTYASDLYGKVFMACTSTTFHTHAIRPKSPCDVSVIRFLDITTKPTKNFMSGLPFKTQRSDSDRLREFKRSQLMGF